MGGAVVKSDVGGSVAGDRASDVPNRPYVELSEYRVSGMPNRVWVELRSGVSWVEVWLETGHRIWKT